MKIPGNEAKIIRMWNNDSQEDFLRLSPIKMHDLTYDAYGENSVIQFRKDINDATLDEIPLFRIVEEYLKIMYRDKNIKLTPLGALPKKVMVELYDKRFLLDELIEEGITKLWREEDCIAIRSARLAAEVGGLVKKANGKLSLTKTAVKLLESTNRLQIFKKFFQAYTDKFSWGYNDLYPDQPIGQFAWAFSLLILHKFGGRPHTVEIYASKYLKAFPRMIEYFDPSYSTAENQFMDCYGARTFERFFLWFGFITVARQKVFFDAEGDQFTRTDLISRLFTIDGE